MDPSEVSDDSRSADAAERLEAEARQVLAGVMGETVANDLVDEVLDFVEGMIHG